ncbi:hypothetical protein CLU79DRAFT_746688 [Phycomyces nitens]|nr:hypothetical protein CLU79DRAFT_746688 [Phycomyces nitens]
MVSLYYIYTKDELVKNAHTHIYVYVCVCVFRFHCIQGRYYYTLCTIVRWIKGPSGWLLSKS